MWFLGISQPLGNKPQYGYFSHSTSMHEKQFNMAVEIMNNLYALSCDIDVFTHLHGSLGLNFHPLYILVHEL